MLDKRKLPQRMQDVLMTIGENAVLFNLFVLTSENPNWNVYQNLTDTGCDLILINHNNNSKIKIEVKTRQRLYSTAQEKNLNTVHFTLSENEYNSCDFLVAYWFEHNYYFVVPKEFLNESKSNEKRLFKFVARLNKKNELNFDAVASKNSWFLIKEKMDELDQKAP